MTRTFSITPPGRRRPRRGRAAPRRAPGPRSRRRAAPRSPSAPAGRRSRRCRPRRSPGSPPRRASAAVAATFGPCQRAVAVDVGIDDRRDAGVLEAPREVDGARRRVVSAQPSTATRPSRASMPTATRPGCAARRRAHQLGVAQRRGAEDHPRDALVEPAPRSSRGRGCRRRAAPGPRPRARIASTAAPFTGRPAKAPSRSTRCSHAAAGGGEGPRLRRRVVAEDRRLRPCAAQQPHALAVLEVDGGVEDHRARSGLRRRLIARPPAECKSPRRSAATAGTIPVGRRIGRPRPGPCASCAA